MKTTLLLLAALTSVAASAATKTVTETNNTLPVDRGRIYRDLIREKDPEMCLPQGELAVSTWQPSDPSYNGYQHQTAPQLGLRFIMPAFLALSTQWSGTVGFNYLQLTRTDSLTLTNGNVATNDRQTSIVEMPLGLEAAPKALSIGRLSGFAGAGLIPSLFVVGHSLDSDGHSEGGLGAYGELGALYRFGGPRFDSFTLLSSAGYRTRVSGDIDTEGFAARFGVRIGL